MEVPKTAGLPLGPSFLRRIKNSSADVSKIPENIFSFLMRDSFIYQLWKIHVWRIKNCPGFESAAPEGRLGRLGRPPKAIHPSLPFFLIGSTKIRFRSGSFHPSRKLRCGHAKIRFRTGSFQGGKEALKGLQAAKQKLGSELEASLDCFKLKLWDNSINYGIL